MLEKIHKFASETSRPIAICGTRIDKWGRATKEWVWNPRKTLVLHKSREMLARLLNRRIQHLCTPYKRQKCNNFYPKYAMYVWFLVFLTRWSKMIGYDNLICNVVWCYGYCLQALWPLLLFLKSLFSFFYMATYAKCTNQDSNCVYAGTILWHKRWYNDTNMMWYVCNERVDH